MHMGVIDHARRKGLRVDHHPRTFATFFCATKLHRVSWPQNVHIASHYTDLQYYIYNYVLLYAHTNGVSGHQKVSEEVGISEE